MHFLTIPTLFVTKHSFFKFKFYINLNWNKLCHSSLLIFQSLNCLIFLYITQTINNWVRFIFRLFLCYFLFIFFLRFLIIFIFLFFFIQHCYKFIFLLDIFLKCSNIGKFGFSLLIEFINLFFKRNLCIFTSIQISIQFFYDNLIFIYLILLICNNSHKFFYFFP